MAYYYQGLFNLMHNEHGLTLTISEMDEIISESQKVVNKISAANSSDGDVMRSFSDKEIEEQARKFCEEWLPTWRKYCVVCKGCNCKNNDTCIHCGCQL